MKVKRLLTLAFSSVAKRKIRAKRKQNVCLFFRGSRPGPTELASSKPNGPVEGAQSAGCAQKGAVSVQV